MKNTCVKIIGKVPSGLVKLFADIQKHAADSAIDYLVVGAMARDLVLVHGFGCEIERGTRDIDFGINVTSWDEFSALRGRLIKAGYGQDERKIFRLTYNYEENIPWNIDIIPFGIVADQYENIRWPPKQDFSMKVHGFSEALEHAVNVQVSEKPEVVIPVASPEGLCLLKLVSWLDREIDLRAKDATDFCYLIHNYGKIPEKFDALYEEGYMEVQEWDEFKACAMKLGRESAMIAFPKTIEFLEDNLLFRSDKSEQFIRDMQGPDRRSLEQCTEWFDIFSRAFIDNISSD